ncbi:leucyl/phenylalanyl-tRNA--protein transferase [Pelagibacterium lentulum]|uniref:Leucyl/phenylalanyl-tRNA--protein transferase n=1 Tax=Pelagibacterium lentulum TaxID=2029865 RepID=A0A916RL11_9HYPH|nr:leucyl/phenylalanyl-tRNA--protein transferase [Pelagibacterium lentulum]GGA60105.1 leucyl/phenylalanyl-tRNA--protein transferase [Pelagibacterium lentulum]
MRNDPFDIELTPELILRAYQAGIFPMSEGADDPDIFWVSPQKRGIIPLDGFRVSKSLAKTLRRHRFDIRVDHDFEATIEACASEGADRDNTWINRTIIDLYGQLFEQGYCHTVEVYEGSELVGGLYGLAIGGAFFGESMFHRRTDASKIALAHLVDRLNAGGFKLLDTQFITPHLASMGAIEISRAHYEARLGEALKAAADFNRLA